MFEIKHQAKKLKKIVTKLFEENETTTSKISKESLNGSERDRSEAIHNLLIEYGNSDIEKTIIKDFIIFINRGLGSFEIDLIVNYSLLSFIRLMFISHQNNSFSKDDNYNSFFLDYEKTIKILPKML